MNTITKPIRVDFHAGQWREDSPAARVAIRRAYRRARWKGRRDARYDALTVAIAIADMHDLQRLRGLS